jgi:chlorobactene glucosyltransferase
LSKRSSVGVWPFIVLIGQLLSAWRAERNYQTLPEVLPVQKQEAPPDEAYPGISVIIPARNEEANLPGLLASLVQQDYPLYEILVVDDASTDGTAAIVGQYADQGVRLVTIDGPPAGWTGKNFACWKGAGESIHPWLLFIDADTELALCALRSSLAFALEHKIHALSLFAQQRCETFWERLLLPFAYQQYFVGVHAQRVHQRRGAALANGQYFLIERRAYQQAGGHAANAESIIDDVALATRLKETGVIPFACRGEQLVAVRMYTSLAEIVTGFGKNSYLFLRQSPVAGIQTAVSTSLAACVFMLCIDAMRKRSRSTFGVALLTYLAQSLGMRPWSRRFGVNMDYTLLAPFAAPVFLIVALNSMLRVLTGRALLWKGRSYHGLAKNRVRYRLPRRWIMDMGRALLFKTPRSIVDDSALAVNALPRPPAVTGVEYIPPAGSFVLVANHYQRLDLWIGWSGALLIDAIAGKRDIVMHFITTDRARIGRFTIPGTRWIIERVAAVWDLVLVTPPAIAHEHVEKPRYALLRILRRLKRTDGQAVCIALMPEGDEGGTSGLIEALPGTGRALHALSKLGFPLVPAGVWEGNGQLHACFGPSFSLVATMPSGISSEALDMWARNTVMCHIAALLPPGLRGKFGSKQHGTLE